jgi:hypothetical protein
MTRFAIGDRVTCRYGKQQGQKAKIIKSSQADVFRVKLEDGSVLFFSGKGLEKQEEEGEQAIR